MECGQGEKNDHERFCSLTPRMKRQLTGLLDCGFLPAIRILIAMEAPTRPRHTHGCDGARRAALARSRGQSGEPDYLPVTREGDLVLCIPALAATNPWCTRHRGVCVCIGCGVSEKRLLERIGHGDRFLNQDAEFLLEGLSPWLRCYKMLCRCRCAGFRGSGTQTAPKAVWRWSDCGKGTGSRGAGLSVASGDGVRA